jgi:GT2 family glycosyltransferase
MSETRPDVTIVVVSWNTRELLDRCLTAAYASAPGLTREIIVIENASSDGSAEWVGSHFPRVMMVRNATNRGYAPACNQGLRVARGRFVMALNSDAFLAGDALGALVRHLEANSGTAAAGPKLLNADGSTQWVCARRAPGFFDTLFLLTQLPAYVPALRPWIQGLYPQARYASTGTVDVLSGACMVFRREAFERVGFLDDRLVLNYDDVEWSLRAGRKGMRLDYVATAEVIHLGGQSRAIDAESSTVVNLGSVCTFWDLVFSRPSATLLKLGLILSLSLTLVKNVVLAPFVAWRRARVAHAWELIASMTLRLMRPIR